MATKQELRDRFNSMKRMAFDEIINVPNHLKWLEDMMDSDMALATTKVEELEARNSDIVNSFEYVKGIRSRDRNNEYNSTGCTIEAMIVALWERLVENRPEKSDALQILREQVKTNNP